DGFPGPRTHFIQGRRVANQEPAISVLRHGRTKQRYQHSLRYGARAVQPGSEPPDARGEKWNGEKLQSNVGQRDEDLFNGAIEQRRESDGRFSDESVFRRVWQSGRRGRRQAGLRNARDQGPRSWA